MSRICSLSLQKSGNYISTVAVAEVGNHSTGIKKYLSAACGRWTMFSGKGEGMFCDSLIEPNRTIFLVAPPNCWRRRIKWCCTEAARVPVRKFRLFRPRMGISSARKRKQLFPNYEKIFQRTIRVPVWKSRKSRRVYGSGLV